MSDADRLTRSDIVVTVLVAGGEDAVYNPIQVQKLLFIVDREISDRIGGPFFDFRPYHYGPCDTAVFAVLDGLATDGELQIDGTRRYAQFVLTRTGRRRGDSPPWCASTCRP